MSDMSETTEEDAWVERLRNGLADAASLGEQETEGDVVVDLTDYPDPAEADVPGDPWASTAETSRTPPIPSLRARLRGSTDVASPSTGGLQDEVRSLHESVRALATQMTELKTIALASPDAVDGESVAWTDVMLLANELRSRVDDLEQQQRVALRGLADWRSDLTALVEEIRDLVSGDET